MIKFSDLYIVFPSIARKSDIADDNRPESIFERNLKKTLVEEVFFHREKTRETVYTTKSQHQNARNCEMKDLIKIIAQSLVDYPEEVEVEEISGNQTTVLELRVAKEDLGKVIGRQGRTALSMRTILSAASTKLNKRAVLEILE